MDFLATSNFWLSLTVILVMLEVFLPGVYFVWLGMASLVTALLSTFLSEREISSSIGLILFWSICSVIFCYLHYRFSKSKRIESQEENTMLNTLKGERGIILEIKQGLRAKFRDTTWKAVMENPKEQVQVGDKVEAVKIDGITLVVRKIVE